MTETVFTFVSCEEITEHAEPPETQVKNDPNGNHHGQPGFQSTEKLIQHTKQESTESVSSRPTIKQESAEPIVESWETFGQGRSIPNVVVQFDQKYESNHVPATKNISLGQPCPISPLEPSFHFAQAWPAGIECPREPVPMERAIIPKKECSPAINASVAVKSSVPQRIRNGNSSTVIGLQDLKREKPNKCRVCDATFSCGNNLKRHMQKHSQDRQYACSICGNTYKYWSGLYTHQFTHKKNQPGFACSVCKKTFPLKGSLVRHMKTHTKEKPFSCLICGKSFSQKTHVDNHMTTHSTAHPFQCSICDKSFKRKWYLECHVKRNHTVFNEDKETTNVQDLKIKILEVKSVMQRF